MVGYSAMMAGDEERALACVAELENFCGRGTEVGGRVSSFSGMAR